MSKKLGDLLDLAPDKAKDEPWSSVPDGGVIWIRRAREEELPEIFEWTKKEVSEDIAPFEVLQRMYQHNGDAIWSGMHRASDNTRSDAKMVGFYALIHLNPAGLEQLEAGTFDGRDPDMRLIMPTATRPAAIYVWTIVVRRVARIATWLLANALGAEIYGGVPIFATAGTIGGLNIIRGYGFTGQSSADAKVGQLFRLDRPPPSSASSASGSAA